MADQMELSSGPPTPVPEILAPAPTTPTIFDTPNEEHGPGSNALQAEADSGTSEEAAQPPEKKQRTNEPTRTCNDEEAQPPKKKQRKDALTVVLAKKPINAGMWAHTDNKEKAVSFVYCQCRTYPDDRNAF